MKKRVQQSDLNKIEKEQFEEIKLLLTSSSYQYNTLLTLSQLAGMSLTNLKKGFKQLYGISIYQYSLHVRLEQSKQLLLTTDMSVKAVGLECGFVNSQHFITTFKKRVGVTPGEYKAMQV